MVLIEQVVKQLASMARWSDLVSQQLTSVCLHEFGSLRRDGSFSIGPEHLFSLASLLVAIPQVSLQIQVVCNYSVGRWSSSTIFF